MLTLSLRFIRTIAGYAIAAYHRVIAHIVKHDPIVAAIAATPDTSAARIEWAAYLYSRYCSNGSVPMPLSSCPT